ncbi:hypothetical protein [Streptomyces sp. NK15101]|uniref:hypothetical protein n=1 Tax=Streptomyces sp. NK15101 TaxID=2873261 RepID=UPI001CED29EB|nr:hypothetical protein [Streptomyces sp. NK15101]
MASEMREDEGEYYCFRSAHVESEEAWVFELSEARPAPASWAGTEHEGAVMPGVVMVAVVAHDAEVEKPPFVRFDPEQPVPFALMKRFVARVAEMPDGLEGEQPPR